MIKLPEPVGVCIKKRNGSLWHFAQFDPKTEERPESDDDFEVETVYTESQLKQAMCDVLEEAAQKLSSEATNARADGRFIHEDATLRCVTVVSKLKEQLE